jgi:hypothetical protein
MRFDALNLGELLRRLGVKGPDLMRGDQVVPVHVLSDASSLGGQAQPTLFGAAYLVAAAPALISAVAVESDTALVVQIRNNSVSPVFLHAIPKPIAAGFSSQIAVSSYFRPNDQWFAGRTRFYTGTTGGPFNFPLESVPALGQLSMVYRVSPQNAFYALGTVLNQAVNVSLHVTELASFENEV